MNGVVAFEVMQPGMLTTVQDLGRRGHARFGVAPGGALDRGALVLGNRLLGNPPASAGLEITLLGPTIRFSKTAVFAITGADLGARLNGHSLQLWTPMVANDGDVLEFNPSAASGRGARAYLCVAGGIAVEPVMSGLGTDLVGGFGGFAGRALKAGDRLPIGEPSLSSTAILRRSLREFRAKPESEVVARVVLGPQSERFTDAGVHSLLTTAYDVTARSNRQGIRLAGEPIQHRNSADMISEGITHGAVQVPGDGQPIVLLASRQTVGGYVKIATVIGADLDAFAQLRPGNSVRFESVSVEEARAATLSALAAIGEDAVVDRLSVVPGWRAAPSEQEIAHVAGDWDPTGVVKVLEAVERTGVTSFSLDVASAGIKLSLQRGGETAVSASPVTTAPVPLHLVDDSIAVVAPVLGTFYRRSAPDQPALAEVGARVTAGQVLGLIEVMKTYHEVTSPNDGWLESFSADDGHYVEYGQEIARLTPVGEGDVS